jgi:virginiamycin B lyase
MELSPEYPITTPSSQPAATSLGPDDALWFTEVTGNNIGRITASGTTS